MRKFFSRRRVQVGCLQTSGRVRGELSAIITRADGSVEDLGVIASTKKRKFPWFIR